ncbi:MAG: C-type lectin domain-containing protein, partial [Oscillospiraceae bacterium]
TFPNNDKNYISNITQDGGDNPIAACKYGGDLIWIAADKPWLRKVADANNGYGWNDDGFSFGGVSGGGTPNNGNPNGILIDTPSKLYSLAWAIQNNYNPTSGSPQDNGPCGAKYANGYYYVTRDLDMTGFKWIPIGTNAIPFTGVFEGEGVHTITGINHKAGLTENGLFGVVGKSGNPAHTIPVGKGSAELAEYLKGTAIYNLAVDGSKTTDKIWNSSTTTHMGGIAAKATDATIQNCSVKNLSLTILNTAGHSVHVGGIVGETLGTTCKLLNNSVGQSGAAMTLTADAGAGDNYAYTGGIVGKATGTAISGNIVGGNNDHKVTIVADPSDTGTAGNYAGGVVGYMDGGSITNETWAHLNAMEVRATSTVTDNVAYAGGVVGYMAGAATMTGCTPGANSGEVHLITAQCYPGFSAGKNYAGGLVGGMSGTSSITNSTIGASNAQSYTVTASLGAESVAGGLVGTMAAGTSLTDCTISGDSINSVMVLTGGIPTNGTAGGLVGTAMDARVIKCSAQNITIAGSAASGGLAGTFKATNLATGSSANTTGGVMAMCYERNCYVTEITARQGSYCDMIQTAENALILACYASKNAPRTPGIYAVKDATGSKFVGCYTTANQAPRFAFNDNDNAKKGTYDNCYFIGGGTTCAAEDTAKGITAETMKKAADGALTQMNTALKDTYNTVTGNLRMGYMAGQSAQINGNYNYPVYAVWLLTVNSLPSSVYGTYTVTADGKAIATNATGFNQYWVGKDAKITITGDPDDYYATADAATFTIVDADGTNSGANVTNVTMNTDKTATVNFTRKYFPGWTINKDLTTEAIDYTGVVSGALGAVTDNKLAGNTVKNWQRDASSNWAIPANARTIKTIFVTAATTTPGASNPIISAFTADGWTVASGGAGQAYIQLTNAQGADAAAVAAIVNSFEFAASKTSTGDVTVDVQVYVDENVRGSMYYNSANGSIYELAGTPASYASAKLLAETSSFGAKTGHLVVIGDSAEHKFLRDNVKTNAWTAAVSIAPNTKLTNWTWDVTGAKDVNYLQNQSSWAGGEPNNSGSYATYNYANGFDDTNGANVALIEYDSLSVAATDWQADSALSTGSITLSFKTPVYPGPGPGP